MARATAKCTCRVCGNTFEVSSIKRNRRDADSWEAWAANYYDICSDCQREEYRKQSEEYAYQAAEDGLPALRGTEKQVSWAETLRHDRIVAINEMVREAIENGENESVEKIEMTLAYILEVNTSAKWWIETRTKTSRWLIMDNLESAAEAELVKKTRPSEEELAEEAEQKEDPVIIPENVQYGTVIVVVSDSTVEAYYPKDDTFRSVMKKAGFTWNPDKRCWEKEINSFAGSAIDRASEISNKLLASGFAIACKDPDVRQKAVSGDFVPECKRWIKTYVSGQYEGWLSISIPRDDPESQDLYDAARKIRGSKWCSGAVAVPIARCDMAEDFARIYEYRLSPGAEKAIKDFRDQKLAEIMEPKKREKTDMLGDILKSSTDIIPDLEDK